MYIAPNSDIKILSGVPLDNTYEHTLAWEQTPSARTTQANYFLTKVKYSFTDQYYQRVKRGWLRIQCNPDNLWDCNYLMFRNTSFGDKWFYAVILSIEYINNETAQINYEIDVMQTWLRGALLDYNPEACYVERQHTATDNFYEHLVPEEGMGDNEYVVDQVVEYDMTDTEICIVSSEYWNGTSWQPADGKFIHHVFGAVHVVFFPTTNTGINDAITHIQKYIEDGKEQSIVSIQMIPTAFTTQPHSATISTLSPPIQGQTLGGVGSNFVPRNKKLYTYPFNKIRVNNQSGTVKDYKWELFSSSNRGYFYVEGTYMWQGGAVTYPSNYRGIFRNMEDAVMFDKFPVCAWSGDAYKAWWAQNSAQLFSSGISSIAGNFISMALPYGRGANMYMPTERMIATGQLGVVSTLGSVLASMQAAKHQPSHAYGDTQTAQLLPKIGQLKFVYTRESYRPEILRIYDAYFNKFGYAVKLITAPAYLNRERWTYVKTIGCNIQTKINNEDSDKICSIYNNGITFWRNASDIGNYELSNNPLS